LPGSACLHAREGPIRCTSREPVRARDQASDLSPDHVLKHLAIQSQVRHDFLQPGVLILELLQPLHLGRQQTGILLLPIEGGRLADPGLPTDLGNRRAFLALLDDKRLLGVENLLAFIRFRSSPS